MYTVVLKAHSLVRWAALILVVIVFARALSGWLRKRPFDDGDRRFALFAMIALDVQLLLGLALYFALSVMTRSALQNFHVAMTVRTWRFWAVEHPTMGVLAVVLAHVARITARRGPEAARLRRTAIGFGLALLLILVAIPWPSLPYGRPLF
jgi:hypothetical protein